MSVENLRSEKYLYPYDGTYNYERPEVQDKNTLEVIRKSFYAGLLTGVITTASTSRQLYRDISRSNHEFFVNIVLDEALERFQSISGISVISTKVEGLRIYLWFMLKKPDEKIQDQIYNIELEFINKYPALLFDFHIKFGDYKKTEEHIPSDFNIKYVR